MSDEIVVVVEQYPTEVEVDIEIVGDRGPQGATGAQGPPGVDGIQGPIGPTGATGPSGATTADASTTVKGLVKMSVPPASSTNPIAVGTNDPRLDDIATGTYVDGVIDDEKARAQAAEAAIAAAAEAYTDTAITGEETRATGAENALSGAIDAEETRATTAESNLATAITAEETRAEAAESALSGDISDEATARVNADNDLTAAINNEATARGMADALLAPLASPVFTGHPVGVTEAPGTNSVRLASTAYADAAVAVEAARAVAVEVLKAPLASPALTGTPTAPTRTALNNSTAIATTEYADAAVGVEAARATAAEALLAPSSTVAANLAASVILAPGSSARNVIQPSGDFKALVIRANAGQTANIFEVQNAAGNVALLSVNNAGIIGVNGGVTAAGNIQSPYFADANNNIAYVNTNYDSTHAWGLTNRTASKVPFSIVGAASQTADLQQWQNSAGTVLQALKADGSLANDLLIDATGSSTTVARGIVFTNLGSSGAWKIGGGTASATYDGMVGATGRNLLISSYFATEFLGGNGGSLNANGALSLGGLTGVNTIVRNITNAALIGLIVRGAPSQTGNLQEWQNSAGTVLASMAANGGYTGTTITTTGVISVSNGVSIDNFGDVKVNASGTNLSLWANAANIRMRRPVLFGNTGQGGDQGLADVPIIVKGNPLTATVSNKALTSNVATLTTSAAHGFVAGRTVIVAGVDATFNGTYVIASVPTSTTFTYSKTNADVASTAATGTAQSTTQTADLTQWQDGLGNVRTKITADGALNIAPTGVVNSLTIAANAQQISQTGSWLTQWLDSSGNVKARVDRLGAISGSKVVVGSDGTNGNNDYDGMQSGSGKKLQIFSWNGLEITAGMGGGGPALVAAGASTENNVKIINTTVSAAALVVKGAASQTANLQEWQNSASVNQASLSASGNLSLNGFVNAGGSLQSGSGLLILTSTSSSGPKFQGNGFGNVTLDSYNWANSATSLYIKGSLQLAATVTNKALTSNVATLTTSAPHNFVVGRSVVVAGVDVTFNGTYTITSVPTSTTFTYAKTNADVASTAATGTAQSTTQTADLQQWQDGLGNVIGRIAAGGRQEIIATDVDATNGVLTLRPSTRANTYDPVLQVKDSSSGLVRLSVLNDGSLIMGSNAQAWQPSLQIQSRITSGLPALFLSHGSTGASANLLTGDSSSELSSYVFNGATTATANPKTSVVRSVASRATEIPYIAKGAASQTADLQQWQNSGGTVLGGVLSDGTIYPAGIRVGNPGAYHTITVPGSGYLTLNSVNGIEFVAGTVRSSGAGYVPHFETNYTYTPSPTLAGGVFRVKQNGTTVGQLYFAGTSDTYAQGTYLDVLNSKFTVRNGIAGGTMLALDASGTTAVSAVVKAVASQTGDIQQWQDSAGTVLAKVDSSGQLYTITATAGDNSLKAATTAFVTNAVGSVIISGPGNSTRNVIQPSASSTTALTLKGGSSQGSADISQIYDSNSVLLASITATGAIRSKGSYDESTTVAGAYLGFNSGTPRVLLADGNASNNWQMDQAGGTLRFYNGFNTRWSVTAAGRGTLTNGIDVTAGPSSFIPASAGEVPMKIKGFSAQTADLQQWQNSGGTVLARQKADGGFKIDAAGKGLTLVSPDGLTTKTLTIDNSGALVVA